MGWERTAEALTTSEGGFVGHHLVTFLKIRGDWVRGVDLKLPEYCETPADDFELLGLCRWEDCPRATRLNGVRRYLLTSSACVRPERSQTDATVVPLKIHNGYDQKENLILSQVKR